MLIDMSEKPLITDICNADNLEVAMLNIIKRKIAISFPIFALSYGIASAGGTQQNAGHKVCMADWIFTPTEPTINQTMHGGL